MQDQSGKHFEAALQSLNEGLSKKGTTKRYDKTLERIGRLKEKYRRVAQHYTIHDSWEAIRRTLESQQRITVSLKREDGKTVHTRKTTRAEPRQKAINDAISAKPGKVEKTIV